MDSRVVEPAHLRPARLRASDVEAMYRIDEGLQAPEAGLVVVEDDLLTSGAHFRAAQRVLPRRFPNIDVLGLCLARRVVEPVEVCAAAAGRSAIATGDDAAPRKAAVGAPSDRRGAVRQQSKVTHSLEGLIQQRLFAVACDYADGSHAARLAGDPVSGRSLASQPTLSRFENAARDRDLLRLSEALAEAVITRYKRRKKRVRRIAIDRDPKDDPTHGAQQLVFFFCFSA